MSTNALSLGGESGDDPSRRLSRGGQDTWHPSVQSLGTEWVSEIACLEIIRFISGMAVVIYLVVVVIIVAVVASSYLLS
jgi:hypothetical protein